MFALVSSLLLFVTAIKNGYSAPAASPTTTVRPEKPLFVPSMSTPTMVHATLYGVGSASNYSPYIRNSPGDYEFPDLLQRQPSYPSFERVLQNILHRRGENRRLPENASPTDEDDYQRRANNLQSSEQLRGDFEDLDRRYKRSTTYVSRNPPHKKTTIVNVDKDEAAALNSRAANGRPYPYTTWLPYYDSPKNNVNLSRRRRHDSEGNENADEHIGMIQPQPQPLFQYAPAYNTYSQFEPYTPLQYSIFYEPIYRSSDNLGWLTNSLHANPNTAHADEFEKFPVTY